MRKEKSKKIKR